MKFTRQARAITQAHLEGVKLAEFMAGRFMGWQQGMPSPIPGWLKQVAKSGMVVPVERLKRPDERAHEVNNAVQFRGDNRP